jgi:hypothetical protein
MFWLSFTRFSVSWLVFIHFFRVNSIMRFEWVLGASIAPL